jgi:hypothetical protein
MNKEDLIHSIETKFKTTMIGALAKFEQNFAYLWENDNINSEKYEDLWEDTRNDILNNGNRQMRYAMKDLSDFLYGPQHNFKQKYNYKFYFNDQNQDNGDNQR